MDSPLHRAAREQNGVLLVRQAVALGYLEHRFRRLAADEGWRRLFRGAYLLPDREPSLLAYVTAVEARWPHVVASRRTAAHLWGLPVMSRTQPEFTGPPGPGFRLPGSRYVREVLASDDVVARWGVRLTSPVRTVVDLLLTEPRDDAVIAADAALHTGLVTLDDVVARLRRWPKQDRRLEAAWRTYLLCDPQAESPVESKARLLLGDAGMEIDVQVPVVVDGKRYRVDLVADGVYLELEGTTYHGGKSEHERDIRRFNELVAASRGTPFIRASHDDVFVRWPRTLALVRDAAAARRRVGTARALPTSRPV